jgi:SAM-dependent methyltransferase
MEPDFAFDDVFDEDYLYFYFRLSDERDDADAEQVIAFLDLPPGAAILDLACGHGRIANRLARRGYRVTGLDRTPLFLERARQQATEWGVDVEYVEGDMRAIPWSDRFDAVVSWFTAFGYFDDDGNRTVLAGARAALRAGGRLVMDMNNVTGVLRVFRPSDLVERDGAFMIDRREWDASSGRLMTERIVIRDGRVRRFPFTVRTFMFPELRQWLLDAGFSGAEAFSAPGEPLELDSRRMVTVATA